MAEEKTKQGTGKEKKEAQEITFTCWRCQRQRPISEMRSVTRFSPVLIVCRDCQKEMR
jgi:hypothetical protein